MSIVNSSDVDDAALIRVWRLFDQMLVGNHHYIENIASKGIVHAVIGKDENTTDIPEYSDLDFDYWDERARGLGTTESRATVSSAEENILCFDGERYGVRILLCMSFRMQYIYLVSI